MRPLIQRFSTLDPLAGGALQVIDVFDALVRHTDDLDQLVRSVSVFAECAAGIRAGAESAPVRAGKDGRLSRPARVPSAALRHELDAGGEVWLETEGRDSPLDTLILERLAIAVPLVRRMSEVAVTQRDCLAVLLDVWAQPREREAAMHQLGLADDQRLVVAALAPGTAPPSQTIAHTQLDGMTAVLGVDRGELWPPSTARRTGVGLACTVTDAWHAWRCARHAYTLTTSGGTDRTLFRWEWLGALGTLVEAVDLNTAWKFPDVSALDEIATGKNGQSTLEVLEAVARAESLRLASVDLHLHHSSVATRVKRAETRLGFEVGTPRGRTRLFVAIVLRRLAVAAREGHAV